MNVGHRAGMNGSDWQRPDLQERYRGYFSWYLDQKMGELSLGRSSA